MIKFKKIMNNNLINNKNNQNLLHQKENYKKIIN